MTKDASIWKLLGELADRLDAHNFQVIDYWDADLCAIAIACADQPGCLVYISTYRQPPGRYAYKCERPHPDEGYEVVERADEVTLEQLVDVIRRHLSMTSSSLGK